MKTGRKPTKPAEKRVTKTVRLPAWLIAELPKRGAGKFIESAICKELARGNAQRNGSSNPRGGE